jgi:hypothetical protein
MIGLTGHDPVTLYWAWSYNDACARAATYDAARRKAQQEQNPFAALVGRGEGDPRRTISNRTGMRVD